MTSPGPKQAKVLFLSTSQLFFTESGPADTLLAMVESALRQQAPGRGWTCAGEVVYVLPNMAQRALAMVDKHAPDIVVLRPTSRTFLHDDVVSRVRDRWPRFYQASLRLADWLRRLSGGDRYGGPGPRGLVFRVPRAIAMRVIGVAPRVPVEQAAAYVEEALDGLLKREELTVLCQVSAGNTPRSSAPRNTLAGATTSSDACATTASGATSPFRTRRTRSAPRAWRTRWTETSTTPPAR